MKLFEERPELSDFCDNLWFQFVKKLEIKDPLVLVYFKISRVKEPLVPVFSKSLKEPAVLVKIAAKNWQLPKRYFDGVLDFMRTEP